MPPSKILGRLPGLRHFIEVAQLGSFRAAAEKLHVAPSAVSKQIKNLELALDIDGDDGRPSPLVWWLTT